MNGRSAHERGVVGEVAVLPGGSNGPNLPTKILSFSVASTTKNASHYAANFRIHVTSLEDPPVAVERVVDQRREHRSKSGIYPFSFTLARCLRQGPQRSPPRGEPAIRDKLGDVCWIVRSMAFPIPPPPVARMAADRPAGKPEVGMGKRMALRLFGSPSRRAELDARRHHGEGPET